MQHRPHAVAIFAIVLSAALLFSSCGLDANGLLDSIGKLGSEEPTAEDTIIDPVSYTAAISKSIEAGKGEVKLNIAASEADLKNMAENLDPFWGAPVSYLVTDTWDDVTLTETGPAIDVKTVEFKLEQSVSYYAYHAYRRENGASESDSSDSGGAGSDGASSGSTGSDGAGSGSAGSDGAGSGSTESDGAGSGSTESDGAGSGSTESDGASVPEPPSDKAASVDALVKALPDIIREIKASVASSSDSSGASSSPDSSDASGSSDSSDSSDASDASGLSSEGGNESLDGSAGNDAYAYALAAHDWLVNNIAYDAFMSETDEGNGVAGALLSRSTMCQGYAESFELLMRCMSDADVRMVVGKGKSEDDSEWVDHAWNIINLDGLWYQVDATFDDPVNSDRKDASHIYFARNDTGMGGDHTWNAEYWPAADSEDFRYYHESGLYAKSKKKLRSIVKKLLKKSEPTEPELAVEGVTLKENDLQFIYDSYDKVENILYSFTEIGDVTIVNLQLEY